MNNTFGIVIHFGDIKNTQMSVQSILDYAPKSVCVIVVNNDPEITLATFFKRSSRITCIDNKKNLGFAKAVNIGLTKAREMHAKYIFLLNNDAYLLDDAITPLIETLESDQTLGIAAPVIEFKNPQKQFDYGGYVHSFFGKTSHDNRSTYINSAPITVDYASGCCIMIKNEVFEKIGMFDEKYFMYYEDVDFCLRARRAGYATSVVAKTKIFHKLSSSTEKNPTISVYHQARSARLFGKQYHGFMLFFVVQMIKYIGSDVRNIVPIIRSLH